MARPRGTYGACALALLDAALQGPATVTELAARSQVGWLAAHRTVSRLVQAGELVKLNEGRPSVLALPTVDQAGDGGAELAQLLRAWV